MASAPNPEQESPIGPIPDAEYGMDCAMNAMLFAEELVEYVLLKLGYTWICEAGARKLPESAVQKRFTPEVGEAVFDILSCDIHYIGNGYKDLQKKGINNMEDFRRELCITTTFHLANGYDPELFLYLAASFVGVSAFYFESGNSKMADASAQVLAYLLNFFIYQCAFNTKKDWFHLCLTAQMIRRDIAQRGKLKHALPSFS